MRDGQTSPHKPRLVVPHSTCPSLSPSPPAHSFIIGPAVINTHTARAFIVLIVHKFSCGGHSGRVSLSLSHRDCLSACAGGGMVWSVWYERMHASACVCVLMVYFLRTPSRAPYRTPSACANRAAYPDPPPVVPHPESIDAQAAYRGRHSTIARLSPARIVSRHWGPPRACHRVPCCE